MTKDELIGALEKASKELSDYRPTDSEAAIARAFSLLARALRAGGEG